MNSLLKSHNKHSISKNQANILEAVLELTKSILGKGTVIGIEDIKKAARLEVGKQIRNARLSANINQKTLATEANISPQMLSGIEHGRHGASKKAYQQVIASLKKHGIEI